MLCVLCFSDKPVFREDLWHFYS